MFEAAVALAVAFVITLIVHFTERYFKGSRKGTLPETMRQRLRAERRFSLVAAVLVMLTLATVAVFFYTLSDLLPDPDLVSVPAALGALAGAILLLNSWVCLTAYAGGTCIQCRNSVPVEIRHGKPCPWCGAPYRNAHRH